MRILYLTSDLNAGGKERQIVELIKNFDKSKYIIGVITFGKNQHYSTVAREYSSYFHELTKRPTRLEPLFTIWKCFHDFGPDIVHTWDSLSSMYAWLPCKYYKIKLVDGSIRDSGIDKGWQYHFRQFFLKRSSLIISNSMAGLKAYHVKGQVVYNLIDNSRFLPSNENREFNLVMVANFSRYKDQRTFLDASVILVNEIVVDKVFLLGGGPYKKKYMSWIAKEYPDIANKFYFTGVVKNVEEYIAKSRVGVLCSTIKYNEGISNSVLEYMASGLVAIVTDLGGSAEIIKNGQNGFLIEPGDYRKIVQIVRLIKNDIKLFNTIALNAKNTIKEKFSINQNLSQLISIYETTLEDNNIRS